MRDRSGKPIVGAMIVMNGGVRVYTAAGGFFHALLVPGSHDIEAIADGYQHQRQKVYACGQKHLIKQWLWLVGQIRSKKVEVQRRTSPTGKEGWLPRKINPSWLFSLGIHLTYSICITASFLRRT